MLTLFPSRSMWKVVALFQHFDKCSEVYDVFVAPKCFGARNLGSREPHFRPEIRLDFTNFTITMGYVLVAGIYCVEPIVTSANSRSFQAVKLVKMHEFHAQAFKRGIQLIAVDAY